VNADSLETSHKKFLDTLLLKIPGVVAGQMTGLAAYFVNDRMFACIYGGGVAVRLPVSAATELQFSNQNVVPFQPSGRPSTREWIQINHADSADYEKDLEIFQSSFEFVKSARTK